HGPAAIYPAASARAAPSAKCFCRLVGGNVDKSGGCVPGTRSPPNRSVRLRQPTRKQRPPPYETQVLLTRLHGPVSSPAPSARYPIHLRATDSEQPMAVYQNYLRDRGSKLGILVLLAVAIQIFYTVVVRPGAAEWQAKQVEIAKTTPGYKGERSLYQIISGEE